MQHVCSRSTESKRDKIFVNQLVMVVALSPLSLSLVSYFFVHRLYLYYTRRREARRLKTLKNVCTTLAIRSESDKVAKTVQIIQFFSI